MIERHEITDRDQWLAWRAADLTASDVGAAVGVDPYKSRLALYAEKTGLLMPQADTNAMRRGRWFEAAVLSAIREEQPDWQVRPYGFYLRDTALRLGATPDATAAMFDAAGKVELVNIQCKVVNRPAYERDWIAGPPLGYVLQTLTEGMLLEADRSLVAALVVDTYTADLYLHPVPRHAAAEARVEEIARRFWENVEAGLMPAVEPERDADVVAALYPQSVPEPVLDLSGDNELAVLLPHREALKEMLSNDVKRLAAMDTEIKAKLGEAERATLPGWKLTWKTVHRNESIIKAYDYRPLLVTEAKEPA